jgi:hypothetical protein
MKLRFTVLALTLAFSTIGAYAQVGLYFNPYVSRISNSVADTGPFAFLGQNDTSQIFGGVVIGGYYELYHAPKFNFSVDMRDAIEHGNNASLNSFLVGGRLTAKLDHSIFKPYLQGSIGDGRTRPGLNPIHVNKFEYDIYAGVDRPLNRHIDWRVLEVGYGSVTTISSYLYEGPVVIPQAKLINFSTGFVFRIP